MKKHLLILTTLLLILLTTLASAQESISFNPEKPAPGDTIQITYNTQGTNLKDQKTVQCVAYLFKNYQWKPVDVVLKETDHLWKGNVTSTAGCGLIAFKFYSGDITDNNNGKCYAIMMTDKDGKQSGGGYAGWALLRAPNYERNIPGYINDSIAISDTVVHYWLQREIEEHPATAKTELADTYSFAVVKASVGNATDLVKKAVQYLLTKPNSTESDLIKAERIYYSILDNRLASDSLTKIILQRFPRGNMARLKEFEKLNMMFDLEKFADRFDTFLIDFPKAASDEEFNRLHRIDYDKLYIKSIITGVIKDNYSNYHKYINQLSFTGLSDIYHKLVEIPHNRKDRTDDQLYSSDNEIIKRAEEIKNQKNATYWYKSDLEWKSLSDQILVNYFYKTHVNILKNKGQFDEALRYAEFAEELTQYKDAEYNNDYAFLLQQKGDTAKLRDVLIKSMYENQASPEMVEMLKSQYVKQYKSNAGFEAYLSSLKNANSNLEDMLAIEDKFIKVPVPDWSMYDLNGKLIESKNLKGKIIIMDFWATWCVPCKASFPGMKMAVEKYKSDTNVVFYFVDTEELSADYKEQIRKYVKDNNYPFQVLFDNKKKGAKTNNQHYENFCKYFHSSGIPFKIFIDRNGNARLATIGNSFSATKLADEVSSIVEIIKKND